MRQPNAKNCSSVSQRDSARKTPPEKKKPMRRAELREHAVPRALARRRVLDREQHGAAPLAAEAEALAEAAQRQQHRRGEADRRRRSAAAPIATVDTPIVSSAATSVVLRPTRSPKWPKSADPIGRARNAIAERRQRRQRGRRPDRTPERTAAGTRAPPPSRRCRSRRTRSSCRPGWRTAPAAANWQPRRGSSRGRRFYGLSPPRTTESQRDRDSNQNGPWPPWLSVARNPRSESARCSPPEPGTFT